MNRLILVPLLAAAACSKPSTETPASSPTSSPASAPSRQPSSRAAAEGTGRAAAGRARLSATEPGRTILASIEAHGGLDAWFGAGTLAFTYDYQPVKGARRRSHQVVDLVRSRAYHDMTAPRAGRLAWDGRRAWYELDGEGPYPARFWALTPYYFVGMPFVLADPGVVLTRSEDDPTKAGFPVGTSVVRVTFEAGTGDAPNDYYVVYLDAKTHQLLGLRYVVSYRPFIKGDMKHTPEKLIVYGDYQDVGGVRLAASQTFFAFGDGAKGPKVTQSDVAALKLGGTFDEGRLEKPEGAVVDRSLDAPN